MILTEMQKTVSNSKSRFKVLCSGRRSGKTYLSINEMAKSKKVKSLLCGICIVCNRELFSDSGNWIINAARVHVCHEPCFEIYLSNTHQFIGKNQSKTP